MFVNLNSQQRALEFYATSWTALNHPAFQSSCLEHGVSPHFVLKIKEQNDNDQGGYGFQKCFTWNEYADGTKRGPALCKDETV